MSSDPSTYDDGNPATVDDGPPYLKIFSLPTAGEVGGVASGTEQYYSTNYGNVHLVSLDAQLSNVDPGQREAMRQWLIADLSNNDRDWTIVIFHHPPYSKAINHNSDFEQREIDMRVEFTPVFEQRVERSMARVASAVALLLFSALSPCAVRAHPSDAEQIELLTQRIEADPADTQLYVAREAAYSHARLYEPALADFRKAEQLDDPVLVAYELAVHHERRGEIAEARTCVARFLARFPGHPAALELQARVLTKLGEREAAVASLERLLAVQSRPNPGSYVSLARLFAQPGGSGVDAALSALDRGMSRLGVIPQLQEVAMVLELQRGKPENALERHERLKPFLGEGPEWKVRKAELLLRSGRAAEALPLLAAASSQLAALRETPARRALAVRISKLEAEGLASASP